MLKDEIHTLYANKKKELEIKECKKQKVLNTLHNSSLSKGIRYLKTKKEEYDERKYVEETKRIIEKLPNKLKRLAKRGESYADIHTYKYYFFVNPSLYENMARYYLDERGKEIISFLEEEGIRYSLATHDYLFESYYTVRVIFNQNKLEEYKC